MFHGFPVRLLGLCCLLAAVPARAAVYCAHTGAELHWVLTDTFGARGNGQDDEIRIPAGTLDAGDAADNATRWDYNASDVDKDLALDISGGWDTSCATQAGSPADTVLDAGSKGRAFDFRSAFGLSGKISLRNLTITRGRSDYFDGAAVAYYGAAAGGSFTMERVAVLDSDAVSLAKTVVYVSQAASGQVKLLDNVFAFNQATASSSSIVHVVCSSAALCSFNNNSIHDNYAADDKLPFALSLAGTIYASNNVVAGNLAGSSGFGGKQAGPMGTRQLSLRNNHFETESFAAEYLEQGTTSGDPKWTQVGAYRIPNATSPLRDSGINSPLGGIGASDVDGHARVQNGVVDRGAIEAAPVQNMAPTLAVSAQYGASKYLSVGAPVFNAIAYDDGLPGPLSFSLTQNTCPDLLAIDAGSGVVRLLAPVPADLQSCNLEVQVFDGEYGDLAQTMVSFYFTDAIFKDGFQ